jgi:hypothetical protein
MWTSTITAAQIPGSPLKLTSLDSYQTTPDFSGFANPTVHNDLSLLYFDTPLPNLAFPSLGLSMGIGDTLTLAGFGRSGYGSYGYSTNAGLTDRRLGANSVDLLPRVMFCDYPRKSSQNSEDRDQG